MSGYLDILEKAFNKADDSLLINSTKPQSEAALKQINTLLKSADYKYKRSLQSAMFSMVWSKDNDYKTQVDISGWHGGGKGNRNYGEAFVIFDLHLPANGKQAKYELKLFDVLDDVNNKIGGGTTHFKDSATKARYLNKLSDAVTAVKEFIKK